MLQAGAPRISHASFALRDRKGVERFLKMAPAALRRLFPEMQMRNRDAFNIMLCLGELANNLRHTEEGRSFFPATIEMRREGNALMVQMTEASEFFFAGIKPQEDLLSQNGRGIWLTHVCCEATGGRLEVDGKRGKTSFEYVVGLPEKEIDERMVEISRRETPAAETISTGA